MAFEHEQAQALRILEGIEQGSMTAAQSYGLIEDADPTLIYLIFTWLRKRYRKHEAAEAVVGRVLEILSLYPAVTRKVKEGEDDPVVAWFEDAYSYRNLDGPAFIALIVEKLEG
ncbi:MAG: hypothetical protein K0V04_37815 [Deltaproteobacteria bacterium]|nr:hypothetical protein [Deltaproteobacteria bacterium]